MAVGEKIVSAFSGPADPYAFELEYPVPQEKTHKIVHSEKAQRLHSLYQSVRDIREKALNQDLLPGIWSVLKTDYPDEWLLPLEILELVSGLEIYKSFEAEIREYLENLKKSDEGLKRLVGNGMTSILQVK
jgi:phenylalanine-4-hydroxylase